MLFMVFFHFGLIALLSVIRQLIPGVFTNKILPLIYAIFSFSLIVLTVASAITFYFWLAPVNSILIRNFLFHFEHYTSLSFPRYSYFILFGLFILSIFIIALLYRSAGLSLKDTDKFPSDIKKRIGQLVIPGIVGLSILIPVSVRNAEYFKSKFVSLKESFIVHDPVLYTFYLALRRSQLRTIIATQEKEIDAQIQVSNSAGNRKNVILITIDALRSDYVNEESKRRELMPFLDSLLENSNAEIYSRAYSNSNYSSTGLLSILEGRVSDVMEEKGLSLQHFLGKAGYKNYFILSGSHAGFNHLDIRYGNHLDYYFEGPFSNRYTPDDDEIIFEGLEYLDLFSVEQPYFIWFHLMGVHYISERNPQLKKYYPDDYNIWATADTANALRYINNYKNGVFETDKRLRRILGQFTNKGELDNSIIVVTSDHGENLGEYPQLGHSRDLTPEQLHIPLLIFDSDLDSTEIIADFTSQLDFPRLVISKLQLPIPTQWQRKANKVPIISAVPGQTGNIVEERGNYFLEILRNGEYIGEKYFLFKE